MARVLKVSLTAVAAIVLLYGIYLVSELFQARALTRKVIIPSLTAANLTLSKADLSSRQLEILLTVEDPTFFSHHGIDLRTPGAGLTTITQSLVKILYFDHFKPGLAKIKQSLLAFFVLDPMISKDDQLKLYLNRMFLGTDANNQPIIGFQNAAQVYFNKDFQDLTEDETIAIVAMIIAPQVFHIKNRPQLSQERVARIKKLLTGEYQPKGLFDMYYGPMPPEVQHELPPMSYFARYYK